MSEAEPLASKATEGRESEKLLVSVGSELSPFAVHQEEHPTSLEHARYRCRPLFAFFLAHFFLALVSKLHNYTHSITAV